MNLSQTLAKWELGIQAGGPGSGRHKEILSQYGFKPAGKTYGKADLYRRMVPGHGLQNHTIAVRPNGSWYHSAANGNAWGDGRSEKDLDSHMQKMKQNYDMKDL